MSNIDSEIEKFMLYSWKIYGGSKEEMEISAGKEEMEISADKGIEVTIDESITNLGNNKNILL